MPATSDLYLGIDVGGTKIYAVLVDESGQILARAKRATQPIGVPLVDQVAPVVEATLNKAGQPLAALRGIGVGVPAVVDSRAGLIVHAPNLEVDDPRLAALLQERFSLPVALGNDVNLGTLAEVWLGAGRGVSDLVGIFVGTGIGGGVILGGELRTGPEDQAGELGHLVLQVDGPLCGCGNHGCFEALASRTAIDRDLRAGLDAGRDSTIAEAARAGRIHSGDLADALAAGDELVTEVMTREAHYLAQGLLSLRHSLNPELIVLGGGVIEACGPFLLPLIQAEVDADPLRRSRNVLRLALSALGDDAVALGAAGLIRAEVRGHALCEAPPEATLPAIDRIEFGLAVIGGREYPHDLTIRADGKIKKRSKKHAREAYGTSHVLDAVELEKVCKGQPALLILGAGFDNMLQLSDDARAWLDSRGLPWKLLPTPEAVAAWNQAEGPRALLLHITC